MVHAGAPITVDPIYRLAARAGQGNRPLRVEIIT